MDELAVYDIPTLLNHILQITGQPSLTYIGFSQGTATCFAALSLNSALNDKINFFIALAATTVPRGLERGLAKTLINSSPELIFLFFGRGIFLRWVHFWVNVLSTSFFSRCIDASLKYLFDWDAKNITSRQKLTMYQHLYTFTSVKQIVHWFQIIRSQRFQMYDDGITMVGRGHIPPSYRLSKIRTPAVIFFGEKDTLVNIDNTLRDCYPEPIYSHEASPLRDLKSVPFTHSQENLLFRNVESRVQLTRVSHYEHLDFLWAEDINETVLPVILPLLREKL